MTWDQTCLRHFAAVMWLCAVSYVHMGQSYSIDQIITGAMTTPRCYGLMYDETHKTVRVDMDMVFPVDEWAKMTALNNVSASVHTQHKRQAIVEGVGARYWPHGIIYYEIDRRAFSKRDRRILKAAMEEWMRYTCVQFIPAHSTTRNKIKFVDGKGCASSVGMAEYPQTVTLSRGCRLKGVVIHELGHVLGFNHEQTRPDRDNYVKIRRENIPDHLEYNFYRHSWAHIRNLGVPYDYLSIMHYGKDAFSANGRVTIETRDRRFQELIGNRRALSFRDIKSANIMYNCSPGCEDQNVNCAMWASRGECHNSRLYMQDYCSKACRLCHAVVPSCRDDNNHCAFWKEKGFCGTATPFSFFITINCRRTCGFCKTVPGPEEGKTLPCERTCTDENEQCQTWAARGECTATPDYMQRYCKKACNSCCSGDTRFVI